MCVPQLHQELEEMEARLKRTLQDTRTRSPDSGAPLSEVGCLTYGMQGQLQWIGVQLAVVQAAGDRQSWMLSIKFSCPYTV